MTNQWKLIADAPLDGTDIIIAQVYCDGFVAHVEHGCFEVVAEDEPDGPWDIRGGEPVCTYEGREAGTYWWGWYNPDERECRRWNPESDWDKKYTHWMPCEMAEPWGEPEAATDPEIEALLLADDGLPVEF